MADLISPEHTRAVGALVVAVSQIETRITDLMAGFMKTDIVTALIAVHHQQLSNRIDTLLALMHVPFKGEAEFNAVIAPVKLAKSVVEFRNTIVHCHWVPQKDGPPMAVRFSARGEFVRTRRPVDPKEILARADEANEIAATLAELSKAFPAKPIEVPPKEE